MPFELIKQTSSSALFSLKSTEKTKLVYPFIFELQISYTLHHSKLTIGYKIINKDSKIMPFAIGAHPAFALPKSFEAYNLLFDEIEDLEAYSLDHDLVSNDFYTISLSKNSLPLSYSLFENDALIIKRLKSKGITIQEKETPILKVQFDDFPNLGLWTKSNAPFICIEPWIGYSDTVHSDGRIDNKEGIQFIKPEDSFECFLVLKFYKTNYANLKFFSVSKLTNSTFTP